MPAKIPTYRPPTNYKRPSAAKRGYDGGWRKVRALKLAADPLCERCGSVALDVHHIDRDTANRSWDNLESLCRLCHNRETTSGRAGRKHGQH